MDVKKFVTLAGLTTYDGKIKTYIANQIGSAGKLYRSVVDALPAVASADADCIYMVKRASNANALSTGDLYDEYLLINGAFELIGNTEVDLSNYATKATTLAGYGIADAKIENGVITLGTSTITPVVDANYVHTDNNYDADAVAKVAGAVQSATTLNVASTGGSYVSVSLGGTLGAPTVTVAETIANPANADNEGFTDGLAKASEVSAFVKAQVLSKNVDAEGEEGTAALVSASAANNKVTVASTQKLKDAVALAESSVQGVSEGTSTENYVSLSVSGTDTVTITIDDSALNTKIGAAALGETAATGLYKTIADAQAAAETKVTELANGAVKTNTEAIAAINDSTTGILKTAKDYTDSLANGAVTTNANAIAALLGTDSDTSASISVKGAKLYADDVYASILAVDDADIIALFEAE